MSDVRTKPAYWNETWHLALQALSANKLRAALTMLGVIIGSACIVLVVTVALAGKRYIVQQIEGVGSNLIYAQLMHASTARVTLSDEISMGDLEAVKQQVPEVMEVAGTHDISMSVVVGGIARPVKVVGVTDGFQEIRRLVVFRGRYFDPDDMMTRSKVCLLTQDLAERVYPNQNPVGQEIRVGDLHFTVIGVFRERISTFGETEIARESVLIPFGLINYYTGSDYLHHVLRAGRLAGKCGGGNQTGSGRSSRAVTAQALSIRWKISRRFWSPLERFRKLSRFCSS